MGYRVVREDYVDVVGKIWMPATTAAYRYPISDYDIENIGEITRDNVEDWLTYNSGDFQSVDDFRASIGDIEIPWKEEESEYTYNDCMYPSEEPCACGRCGDD